MLIVAPDDKDRLTLRFQLQAKPMSLDPILWQILLMPENEKEPLSFRHWAAFQCQAPVVAKQHLPIEAISPEGAAELLLAWLSEQALVWREISRAKSYLSIFEHLDEQDQGLTPSLTKVISLIDAGETTAALHLAAGYASGKEKARGLSYVVHSPERNSAYEMVVKWLRSQGDQ